jgi:hypothetical protein
MQVSAGDWLIKMKRRRRSHGKNEKKAMNLLNTGTSGIVCLTKKSRVFTFDIS